jgi:hypothetical protein
MIMNALLYTMTIAFGHYKRTTCKVKHLAFLDTREVLDNRRADEFHHADGKSFPDRNRHTVLRKTLYNAPPSQLHTSLTDKGSSLFSCAAYPTSQQPTPLHMFYVRSASMNCLDGIYIMRRDFHRNASSENLDIYDKYKLVYLPDQNALCVY